MARHISALAPNSAIRASAHPPPRRPRVETLWLPRPPRGDGEATSGCSVSRLMRAADAALGDPTLAPGRRGGLTSDEQSRMKELLPDPDPLDLRHDARSPRRDRPLRIPLQDRSGLPSGHPASTLGLGAIPKLATHHAPRVTPFRTRRRPSPPHQPPRISRGYDRYQRPGEIPRPNPKS